MANKEKGSQGGKAPESRVSASYRVILPSASPLILSPTGQACVRRNFVVTHQRAVCVHHNLMPLCSVSIITLVSALNQTKSRGKKNVCKSRESCVFRLEQTQRLLNHFCPSKLFKLAKHYGLDSEPIASTKDVPEA